VAEITDIPERPRSGRLTVVAENTLTRRRSAAGGHVVLSVGLEPAEGADALESSGAAAGQRRLVQRAPGQLAPVETATGGIFLAGCCQVPRTSRYRGAGLGGGRRGRALLAKGTGDAPRSPSSTRTSARLRSCLDVCPYSAIRFDEADGGGGQPRPCARLRQLRGYCPSSSAGVNIHGPAGDGRAGSDIDMSAYEPKIIVMVCNWCTYTAADLAGTSAWHIGECAAGALMCTG